MQTKQFEHSEWEIIHRDLLVRQFRMTRKAATRVVAVAGPTAKDAVVWAKYLLNFASHHRIFLCPDGQNLQRQLFRLLRKVKADSRLQAELFQILEEHSGCVVPAHLTRDELPQLLAGAIEFLRPVRVRKLVGV